MCDKGDIAVCDWHGCYDESWRGLIVDEAFAHPAKFAPGLVRRIYTTMLDHGWLRPGEVVGDPFGGVGGGGIIAASLGLVWRGVELEPRFVAMANRNFARLMDEPRFEPLPRPEIVQGDSRRFAELVGAAAVVTSPPYADSVNSKGHGFDWTKGKQVQDRPNSAQRHYELLNAKTNYGATPGQIGALTPGDLSAVVTSPPFTVDQPCASQTRLNGDIQGPAKRDSGMVSDGQIGALPSGSVDGVVTSPPWENQEAANAAKKHRDPEAVAEKRSREYANGTLKGNCASKEAILRSLQKANEQVYGGTDGQLGNTTGETYWEAVAQVYAQCRLALRPGGVLACVVKNYVKGGQVVTLCDQTWTLLLSLGFQPLMRARAMLVSVEYENGRRVTRERKSFFRRLAEKKGSPRIDWEEVLFAKAPTE